MDNIFYELIKYMTTYNYSSSLAIPLKLMGNLKGTSLPAVYASLASFRNEAKICQTTTCNMPQPQYLYHCYTMHVLRNTDYGSEAHRNPNVEQIPIMYNFYNSDGDYIGKMLDEFGLINMNGRCYDPVVGRFLSPDILVQNPNNTQCYNRYSYAINNPLKYSDPSGWSYGTLDQMHNNAQRASWMAMNDFNDRMQAELNISSVKIIGQNSLKFFGSEAEGAQHFSITEIVELLKMIKTPGLFGNPGNKDSQEADPTKTDDTTIPKSMKQQRIYGMALVITQDVGLVGAGEFFGLIGIKIGLFDHLHSESIFSFEYNMSTGEFTGQVYSSSYNRKWSFEIGMDPIGSGAATEEQKFLEKGKPVTEDYHTYTEGNILGERNLNIDKISQNNPYSEWNLFYIGIIYNIGVNLRYWMRYETVYY